MAGRKHSTQVERRRALWNARGAAATKEVVELSRPEEFRGTRVGRLVGWSAEHGPLVDYPGNPRGPVAARTAVPLDEMAVGRAVKARREVLLSFDAEWSDGPIILGLLEPSPRDRAPVAPEALEVFVDGRRVVLDAEDEIVLRCGKASVTLRRNGRIVVRGTYVETCSAGVNRIKGGHVKIN